MVGTIFPRGSMLAEFFGGMTPDRFSGLLQAAAKDQSVTRIVIDVDSPGGAVAGVPELAAEIRAARGAKPITAVANGLAASAAYWLATQADEVVITPSGEVGSIGVFAAHIDMSRALDQAGITPTLISAGKYKTEGNPYQPLSDEARAAIQARVDDFYGMFVKDVAKGRGVSVDAVRFTFGEGRTVGARQAVDLGMADRVATLAEVLRGAPAPAGRSSMSAELEFRQRRARALGGE